MATFKQVPLSPDDVGHLEAKRSWVRGHFDESARHEYQELGAKLRLIDTILTNRWVEPTETVKLQSLGVCLGDALVQELGLRWMAIEDEVGRDIGLVEVGTSIRVWPMTAISKRLERGEEVDVYDLFKDFCETVVRLRAEAD